MIVKTYWNFSLSVLFLGLCPMLGLSYREIDSHTTEREKLRTDFRSRRQLFDKEEVRKEL